LLIKHNFRNNQFSSCITTHQYLSFITFPFIVTKGSDIEFMEFFSGRYIFLKISYTLFTNWNGR
jgi:hypothetical protein